MKEEKIICLAIFIIISLYTFYQNFKVAFNYPIVFGDEGFHMTIARDLANYKELFAYQKSYIDKVSKNGYTFTQYFHFFESFLFLFGENVAKIGLPITVFITALAIFIFASIFFDYKVALLSSILFQMFPSVVIYSTTFYADMHFTLFTILSFFFVLFYFKTNDLKYLITSSILIFLLLISKPLLPYLIVASILFIFIFQYFKTKNKNLIIHFIIFVSIFSILFSSLLIRNLILFNSFCIETGIESLDKIIFSLFKNPKCSEVLYEHKPKYEFAARTEKIGSEQDMFSFGFKNYADFAYGYSLILLFSIFGLALQISNKQYEYFILFLPLFILIITQLIQNKLLTTGIFYRVEDTARYTLQYSPFIAILFSYGIVNIINSISNLFKKKFYIIMISLFIVVLIVLLSEMYKPYSEKLDMMKKLKSFSSYFFEACNWVKNNLPKNVTLHSLWAYRVGYNCERNVGGSGEIRLSKDLNYTLNLTKLFGVDYLFIEKFSIDPLNRRLTERYDLDWVEWLLTNKEHFEKVYENGIPIEQCIQFLKLGYPCDGVIIFKIIY